MKIISEILYGESDGILIWWKQDTEEIKHAEVKMAIAYTGKVRQSGNRKQLENKLPIAAADVSILQWQEMIHNHLYARYDMDAVKLTAVGGDNGSWVESSFDLCGVRRIERYYDECTESYVGKTIALRMERAAVAGRDQEQRQCLPSSVTSRSWSSVLSRLKISDRPGNVTRELQLLKKNPIRLFTEHLSRL